MSCLLKSRIGLKDMSLSLEGKVAIVTGASRSRGIGAQIAYELAKRGAKVGEDTLPT